MILRYMLLGGDASTEPADRPFPGLQGEQIVTVAPKRPAVMREGLPQGAHAGSKRASGTHEQSVPHAQGVVWGLKFDRADPRVGRLSGLDLQLDGLGAFATLVRLGFERNPHALVQRPNS